ncbi:MAG: Shedu immune nuclease family protein [Bryobacteraceae bacterium]
MNYPRILEVLIGKYEEMLAKDLSEKRWQALFNDNPLVLNLAFGYPVIKIQDQAHVGGQRLSGSGDTITDFLVKNGISNNAALFEIKTPSTPLLNRTPYRGQVYTPSSDLSGAINQMLDQRSEFQRNVARIKENSRIYNLESHSVHGVLIIGTTPEGLDQQKSFELFRGNSKDITVVTFDELLAKLKLLHEFQLSHAPAARQAAALHSLETKVLRLQYKFHELYEYTESKSGSIWVGTSKPLPGVDGRSVATAIGELAILKLGFDRARLQIPPYPVAFDESGERAIKVQTLDEFVEQAERAVAEADAVLALQIGNML